MCVVFPYLYSSLCLCFRHVKTRLLRLVLRSRHRATSSPPPHSFRTLVRVHYPRVHPPRYTSDAPFSVSKDFHPLATCHRSGGCLATLGHPTPYCHLLPYKALPHPLQSRQKLRHENTLSSLPSHVPAVPMQHEPPLSFW